MQRRNTRTKKFTNNPRYSNIFLSAYFHFKTYIHIHLLPESCLDMPVEAIGGWIRDITHAISPYSTASKPTYFGGGFDGGRGVGCGNHSQ